MKPTKVKLLLVAIVALAFVMRFWQLGLVPASPDWDEAALGYNAYSLLKTGRDEYGQFLPVVLRSFDDYKPALYAYLAILPVKIFGLNLWAVRLPSAIIGVLAVLFTYLLVKELFRNYRYSSHVSLITSFLLAVSPWHLQFSRAAFETATGMFLDILVAWSFLKGLKKPIWLLVSAFIAGLNLYVYQAEKIFTPLLVLAMVLIWRREVFKLPKKYLLVSVVIGLLTLIPIVKLAITTPEIFLRAKGTSFASDQTVFLSRTAQKLIRDFEQNDILGKILDNRRVTYLLSFLSGYLSHFNLNWLFISGDDARHHAPGMGIMYLIELPFFLYGIYWLVFDRPIGRGKQLIWAWLLLAPLPAAFTSGVPHAVRALRLLPIMQIFTALGICQFMIALKNKNRRFRRSAIIMLWLMAGFNIFYYLNQYYIQMNYFNSSSWQYGYRQAVEEVQAIADNYDQVVVSNQPYLDQSYMFFLYYLKYDPTDYQRTGGTVSGGFAEDRNSFGKYVFRPINWDQEEKNGKILYVGRVKDFSVGASIHKTINFLDGQPAIAIVKGK